MSYMIKGLRAFKTYKICINASSKENNKTSHNCINGTTDEYSTFSVHYLNFCIDRILF